MNRDIIYVESPELKRCRKVDDYVPDLKPPDKIERPEELIPDFW